LLLWVLPAVNLAAVFGLAWLGGWLARQQGLSGWWGFVLPLAVNTLFPTLRDLTDPLALLAVCGLLVAWQRNWPWWALALWAAAAVFSREQNVLVVLLLLGCATWKRQEKQAAALSGVLAVWLAWVALLCARYGSWPFLPAGHGTFAAPFAGLFHGWTHLDTTSVKSIVKGAWPLLNVMLQLALGAYLVVRRRDGAGTAFLLAGMALAVLSGPGIYKDPWSYSRVFAWLPLGIWLTSVREGNRLGLFLLLPTLVWPLLAVRGALLGAG
jgi:hypothetical protein